MTKKLKIVKVDPYGYCGREYHPEASDEGLIVTVLRAETMFFDGRSEEPVLGEDGRLYMPALEALQAEGAASEKEFSPMGEGGHLYCYYEAVTQDGRRLTLVDHEVEAL